MKRNWKSPNDWQETLVDTMHEVLAEAGIDGATVTKRGGPGHRHMWSWGNISKKSGKYSLPTTRSLVAWCESVGIKPSELLKRAGL